MGLPYDSTSPNDDGCRVLIVEDNPDMANLLAVALRRQMHEIETTRNGTEALVVAATFRPHIVIVDIGLPGVDGYYVTRELRRAHSELLIIAVSGRSAPEDIEEAQAAGCDHYLVKPVDLEALSQILEAWKAQEGCEAA
jgi:DNA-binding response OmpR family regulator